MSTSHASFDFIRAMLAELSAIALEDDKKYLVETRLLPVARQAGLSSIDDLVTRLRRTPNDPLRQQVVEAMTTNETSFFRDQVPFETLRTIILPDLLARREGSRKLNVWSAACASGQEPYSIAMLWCEHFSHLDNWSIRVLGTDISEEVLQRARDGRFTQLEIERGVPEPLLQKYFRRTETDWVLESSVRQMVEFRQLNLHSNWPALPIMDVILLRNVLVYFDSPTRQKILRNVRGLLRPDGYLLLGGAESALNIDDAFQVTRSNGFSYYQLKNE
jgi:chemotaxis protein methyltransferase CheR